MANFEETFTTFALLALFVISFFAFIIIVQAENHAEDPIVNDPLLNLTYSTISENVAQNVNKTEANYLSFNEENPTIDAGSIVLSTIISGGKIFSSMILGTWNTLIGFPARVLGIDERIVGIIFTILIIGLIIGLWILVRFGG